MVQIGHSGKSPSSKQSHTSILSVLCITNVFLQDPDEDEETRQYRLKLEEQKRLREEILRRKEMRRQMQAGVRKKELLDRLNSTPSQGTAPAPNQHQQHQTQQTLLPVLQQQQQEQRQQTQPQPQQQRQFPQRTPQSLNQSVKNPTQGAPVPPNGEPQTPMLRPNVKARLQLVKGSTPQPLTPVARQTPQQLPLQRRNSALQNRPGAQLPPNQTHLKTIPVSPSVGPGHAQAQGPKPGAKRTVMQRAKDTGLADQQLPQKVRVVKLSGAVRFLFHLLCFQRHSFHFTLFHRFYPHGIRQV